ncbi:TATA box-binding protein-associated factor RNA polymerase I subunit B [Mycetomoellerius zeteki]|uniref:TATA box-binding protein-associated factor RNA polymerase I subunit B n=1 Tax=Mycetomoellerius zeteki TaxID=64791 RepID=UPI00084EC840|nr:PREDICTED: TATA box-binding protein-associated factor RNA polymerase I subunit B [Trachymyrmex zeteki]XP_018310609.1 PREDICTED: TATA box-binding protein-associated factor RNA polymerase I subunit B [Trachymyrmex zeteki]
MKKLKCVICGCSDFFKASGYSFCMICQTQSQDIGEELEYDLPMENTTRLQKTKIHRAKRDRTGEEVGWTSWELYNFALIGLTNELIELGVPADIKVTVLQLWARYLGKLEVAFVSTEKKVVPKLARRYQKKDAKILYGRIPQKRPQKRRKTESNIPDSTCPNEGISSRELNRNKKLMVTADYDRFIRSQGSSEEDALSIFSGHSSEQFCKNIRIKFNSSAKEEKSKIENMAKKVSRSKRSKYKQNHITTQYKTSPELITPTKLWAILYLALRIHNQDIHLSDMIRYGREGRLSYYRLDRLIPPEISLTKSDMNFLSRAMDITHRGMRKVIGQMAKFLGVTKIICPDLYSLVNRYCIELALPKGISLYAERLISLSSPKMTFDKISCIPNYEGRAMAFIIVILKTLLSLDGITENKISNVAEKINSAINDEGICDTKLFSFREWQKYIECRRTILINAHCPTKLKYNPNIPDVNSLYIKFLNSTDSKIDREEPEITIRKHLIPNELVYAMKQCITDASYIAPPLNEVNDFSPTLTPNHSYLQQLLEHPLYDLPSMLRNDFLSTKIRYLRKSKCINKLISHYDIQIDPIDSNLHFIEKTVPVFEQTKIASIKDLKDEITIEDFMEDDKNIERKENFIDYLFKEIPCQFKIDVKKKQYYDDTIIHMKAPPLASALTNEFIFNEILPDGKLSIPGRYLNDDESEDDDVCLQNIVPQQMALSLSKFCKAYNTNLSSTERKAILTNLSRPKKEKRKLVRNSFGKFVKQTDLVKQTSLNMERKNPNKDDNYMEQTEIVSTDISGIENMLPEISDILNLSANASIFDNFIKLENEYGMNDQSEKETCNKIKLQSIIDESVTDKRLNSNILKLFKPFKDYWMYHCNFSRVKSKNFEILEKMLPRSFRWLLNECASNIEMSTEDLYEEVCLIEAYYAYVSEESKIYSCPTSKSENCNNQAYIKAVLKKW